MARFVVIDDNGNRSFSKAVEQAPNNIEAAKDTTEDIPMNETIVTTEPVKSTGCFLKRWFTLRKKSQEPDVVYTLDQEGLDKMISIIADALSEKFVSKDEIKPLVEHTIQRMVVSNDVNENNKGEGK